jgi:hypothetical protein
MIPFKTLRFSNSPSQEWGVNLNRIIHRLNEESNWSPIPIRYSIARMSLAGTLSGLENIRQGRNLKVKPFVTAGFSHARPLDDPLGNFATNQNYDGGVDVKYGLTQSVTLDATYRTDFAQVEVDEQQVNLTRFSLFFPEKREFFLENAGTFTFGGGNQSNLVPFFSRRIGLSPSGTPIPIVGGARVTGQVGRYDLGFLDMQTESQDSTPSNNYFVGRLKRNLLTNSWVGGLITNRDSTVEGDYNRVYGADAHFQFYNRLEVDSYILRSDTPGLSDRNQARQFQTAWRGDELNVVAGYYAVQANFNPEVGFIRRKNNTQYSGEFSWNPLIRRSETIRNLIFRTEMDYFGSGRTGKVETRTKSVNFGVQFQNNGSINVSIKETFDRLVGEFRIRPEIPIPVGDYEYRSYSANASSDRSKKISGNGSIEWGEFWNGSTKSFTGRFNLKPNYHLNFELSYRHNRVTLPNGRFTTDLVGTRFIYAFTPRAFINAFVQYNSDTHRVSSNIRFNLTHHPLSDLFLVYNDVRDTDSGRLVERAFIVKFTNLFNF